MSEQESSVRCDYLPGCGYKIWQDAKEFTYTTDSVFLGNFPHVVRKAKVLELGCGTGAISMLLEHRGAEQVTAIDCNPRITELMRRSIADNNLQEKFTIVDGDIRNYKQLLQPPERFAESMQLALKYGLQPKRLQWVHSRLDKPAWIFLMEMQKGGSYGLDVLPPLIMYNADGSYTEAAARFYTTK